MIAVVVAIVSLGAADPGVVSPASLGAPTPVSLDASGVEDGRSRGLLLPRS